MHRRDRACRPVLVVAGEIDMAVAPAFGSALNRLIGDAHSPAYLDLTGVSFFDSSGIETLVEAQAKADGARIELIIDPSLPVQRTLELVGLASEFRQGRPPPVDAVRHGASGIGASDGGQPRSAAIATRAGSRRSA